MSWQGDTFILDAVRDPSSPMDPHPDFATLRERPPSLVRGTMPDGTVRDMWLLTRHEDVRALLAAPDTSNRLAVLDDTGQPGWFVFADPPDHTRLRRMLTPAFTTRHIEALRPRVEAIVAAALDAMTAAGPGVDLVAAFAAPVPSRVICELLGVPYARHDEFQRHSLDLITGDNDRQRAALAGLHALLTALVAQHRAAPGDDLLSGVIRDHGGDVTDAELAGIGTLLLTAGHETTSRTLASGALTLLRHPEQATLVRDEAAAAVPMAEEVLRFLSVESGGIPRLLTADVEIGGQLMRAGEVARVMLPAANRDPALTADPDRFDVRREPARHVAFGHGIHRCLGAPLARMELSVALPALLRRFPRLRVAVPEESLEFDNGAVRALPVAW